MTNITNEDCMELMSRFDDNHFELAIVDPPYGIDVKTRVFDDGKKWDNEIPKKDYFDELFRVSKNQIIWGGNYFTEHLPPSKGWIVWDKKADIKEHLSMAELAWTSFNKKCNVYEHLWAGFKKKYKVNRIHPTEKPVQLYEWILTNYAKENDKILDTHLGSGSIAIACHNLGYDLTACELDEDYFNAACKRIEHHTKQLRMF